jgi:hypothetical protein
LQGVQSSIGRDLAVAICGGQATDGFRGVHSADFEHLSKTTELDVSKDSEDAILMQSVEGHAHNGAGCFTNGAL